MEDFVCPWDTEFSASAQPDFRDVAVKLILTSAHLNRATMEVLAKIFLKDIDANAQLDTPE